MRWYTKALSSPIGQKVLMALSGLFLVSFLVVHLTGNVLLMLRSTAAFEAFTEFMETNPIIAAMEYVLFGGFILHVIWSIVITRRNSAARPVKYATANAKENSTWFSRNMGLSGSIVFIFLVIHLRTFFIPEKILHSDLRPFQEIAFEAFANPLYDLFYVFSMVLLAFHLNHGIQSSFQTLGLRHQKYTPIVKALGLGFSIIVPGLFALIPIVVYFTH